MTRVRRVGIAVSDFVVRYAPTGSDEWARGLRAEFDVIDSDWAALGWALGSLRVLLRKPLYREPYAWLPAAVFLYYFVTQTLTALLYMRRTHWHALAGGVLTCAGWFYFLVLGSSGWLRQRAQPDPADRLAVLLYQREGLERLLARFRTIRRWFPHIAVVCMALGYDLRYRPVRPGVIFWMSVGVLVVMVPLRTPAEVQRRMAELDKRIERTRLTGR